ncbi:MAG: DUF503 domain-containing protein [Dehalococcoidia bacterium]|nr:DUF503 domain-containing protein [Dehalococcoidia bacterium]
MHIAVCRVTLRLAENHSLKGKRKVVQSVTQRVRQRFNVSIAEVGEQDQWKTAVLGFTCVNSDPVHLEQTVGRVVGMIEDLARGDAELVDAETEVTQAL